MDLKETYLNGVLIQRIIYKKGTRNYHCTTGPAYEEFYDIGALKTRGYWVDNKRHNDNGPALTSYHENGITRQELWYHDNYLDRDEKDGPSFMSYYETGIRSQIEYHKRGLFHRSNGPAAILYYENGNVKREAFYENNYLHNENGPAIITYDDTGKVTSESYYLHNNLHPTKTDWQHALAILAAKTAAAASSTAVGSQQQNGCQQNCCICNLFDMYAEPQKDGKIYCYVHLDKAPK